MTPLSRFFASCCVLMALLTSQRAFATYHIQTDVSYTPEHLDGNSRTWIDPWDYNWSSECFYVDYDEFGYLYCVLTEYNQYTAIAYAYVAQGAPVLRSSASDLRDAKAEYGLALATTRQNLGVWYAVGDHYYQIDSVLVFCGYYGCENLPQGSTTVHLDNTYNQTPLCLSLASYEDSLVVGVMNTWVAKTPYEIAFLVRCNGTDNPDTGNFNDSFGTVYPLGTPYTNDPCATRGGLPGDAYRLAGAHKHPWFDNAAQYHAGNGCLGDKTSSVTPQQLSDYNNVTNAHFSQQDRDAMAALGQKSMFLRIPDGSKCLRIDTSTQSNPVQVYP